MTGLLPHECRYQRKRRFLTSADAEAGARRIRAGVEARGQRFVTLYPYRCPDGDHWHLSKSPQDTRDCPTCGQSRPSWLDPRRGEWVVYAHGDCPTQAVGE